MIFPVALHIYLLNSDNFTQQCSFLMFPFGIYFVKWNLLHYIFALLCVKNLLKIRTWKLEYPIKSEILTLILPGQKTFRKGSLGVSNKHRQTLLLDLSGQGTEAVLKAGSPDLLNVKHRVPTLMHIPSFHGM